MTRDEQDLARRLAEHPRWRWMRGMCALTADHPVDEFRVTCPEALREASELATCIPDLADSATQGCLIAMLTDRLLTIGHRREEDDGGELWRIVIVADDGRMQGFRGATLGEALARAVLAAWGEA